MRRGFLRAALLGLIIVAAPLVAEAQPEGKVWRIGLFHVGLDHVPPSLQGLREGLKALGYVDGKNLRLEWRNLPDEAAPSTILEAATRRRLPVAFHRKEWVERGALFSYGADFRSVGEDAAQYVDRIFKGASPAALPVQQISRFEFVINQKIAKTLGVTIPPSLLLRADKVIE